MSTADDKITYSPHRINSTAAPSKSDNAAGQEISSARAEEDAAAAVQHPAPAAPATAAPQTCRGFLPGADPDSCVWCGVEVWHHPRPAPSQGEAAEAAADNALPIHEHPAIKDAQKVLEAAASEAPYYPDGSDAPIADKASEAPTPRAGALIADYQRETTLGTTRDHVYVERAKERWLRHIWPDEFRQLERELTEQIEAADESGKLADDLQRQLTAALKRERLANMRADRAEGVHRDG